MKNLKVIDTLSEYGVDKISCYERPIVNILNSYHTKSGDCYILLSKIYEVFDIYSNIKDRMTELLEDYYGATKVKQKRLSHAIIENAIDDNVLVIVGCNLREIYYSSHYCESSWPHWNLITGYDKTKRIYKIFDNEHLEFLGKEYSDFYITYDMLQKSNRSYCKEYDNNYSLTIIKNNGQFNYIKTIRFILDEYIKVDINDKKVYRQYTALKKLQEIINIGITDELVDEYKKKVVNINKYKMVIIDKIIDSMVYMNYLSDKIDSIRELKGIYERELNIYTLKKLLDIEKGIEGDYLVTDSIVDKENTLMCYIKEYAEFLKVADINIDEIDEQRECFNEDINNICEYEFDKNEDGIIKYKDGVYLFDFWKNGRYPWAEEDYAPKVRLIRKDVSDKIVEIKVRVKVIENPKDTDYMAGIYIKNANGEKWIDKAFLASINKENLMLIGELGEYESDTFSSPDRDYTKEAYIYLRIDNNEIIFGEIIGGQNVARLKRGFMNVGIIEAGIVCETWDNAESLKVSFEDVSVEYV